MIIGLSGYARSGKDTVAEYLVDNYGFKRVAFADEIKNALLAINPWVGGIASLNEMVEYEGWDNVKIIPQVREMMQNFGVHARENWGTAFWINQAFRYMDKYCRDEQENLHHVVITDVRFKNEADAIAGWRDGTLVRINRSSVQPINQHINQSTNQSTIDQSTSNQ